MSVALDEGVTGEGEEFGDVLGLFLHGGDELVLVYILMGKSLGNCL